MLHYSVRSKFALPAFASAALLTAQPPDAPDKNAFVEFVCPMDKDIRANAPGFCSRCGMKLVAGIPEPREFRVRMDTRPGSLTFRVEDPDTDKPVQEFEVMHEKLYHLFVVSQGLDFFLHTHPERRPDGSFTADVKLPHPGMYRVLSDFYPKGATPQLVAGTVIAPGQGFPLSVAQPLPDLAPKQGENLNVELVAEPAQPIAGFKTLLFFRLKPNDGIQPYIGAMGHMLAASADLIDMMHLHPVYVTDGADYKQLQFNMIFPREGTWRIWVQFQRQGVVNTVAFNVPVGKLQ